MSMLRLTMRANDVVNKNWPVQVQVEEAGMVGVVGADDGPNLQPWLLWPGGPPCPRGGQSVCAVQDPGSVLGTIPDADILDEPPNGGAEPPDDNGNKEGVGYLDLQDWVRSQQQHHMQDDMEGTSNRIEHSTSIVRQSVIRQWVQSTNPRVSNAIFYSIQTFLNSMISACPIPPSDGIYKEEWVRDFAASLAGEGRLLGDEQQQTNLRSLAK